MSPFPGHCYHFASLDSTQRYLLQHPPGVLPILCTARTQSAGTGQRGRSWQSPPGQLYFSLRWNLPGDALLHQGLTQMIALSIAEVIDPEARHLQLKWPNDLFIAGNKCGGILIDTLPNGEHTSAIIGIGINLSRSSEHPAQSACLNDYFAPDTPSRLLARLLPALCAALERWAEKPYLPLAHRWEAYDAYFHATSALENHDGTYILRGIDQKGRLIAQDANAVLHFLTATRLLL